ncbi:hypothetical protein EDB89DRAFT_1913841 [Lactarius sanguifluus]|nr:hypothetical protein EDB89DRAFT_1913841 [Lactarius sanguifluus]
MTRRNTVEEAEGKWRERHGRESTTSSKTKGGGRRVVGDEIGQRGQGRWAETSWLTDLIYSGKIDQVKIGNRACNGGDDGNRTMRNQFKWKWNPRKTGKKYTVVERLRALFHRLVTADSPVNYNLVLMLAAQRGPRFVDLLLVNLVLSFGSGPSLLSYTVLGMWLGMGCSIVNGQRTKGTNTFSLQNLDLILIAFVFLLIFNQREDRDKSILHETEAILLPPRSWLGQDPNILETFFALALALVNRSKVFGQYKDAIYAARYLRYLRDQPQFGSRRHEVTASLVDLEARNVMQCIEEMAVLCHELLTLDPSNDDTTDSLTHLAGVFLSKFSLSAPDQPLNQIIECLRLARKHRLDMGVSFALAASLLCRYFTTFVNDDYEEAASALDE